MLMTAVTKARLAPTYPELAGKRVLITGLTAQTGVDIARAFADHATRLVLQVPDTGDEMQAVAEMLAVGAAEIAMFTGPIRGADAALMFARQSMTAFSGLDAVINVIALDDTIVEGDTADALEAHAAEKLILPCLVSKVAANRMRVTLTEGVVLNVALAGRARSAHAIATHGVIKSALGAMTRREATEWAPHNIRFNAIAPPCGDYGPDTGRERALAGEPDIAALALYLASGRGRALSGHIFEADPSTP
jgi:NAD(P)-dependent dehydrogenase (short-subunit alcohol dehydrogenase family)